MGAGETGTASVTLRNGSGGSVDYVLRARKVGGSRDEGRLFGILYGGGSGRTEMAEVDPRTGLVARIFGLSGSRDDPSMTLMDNALAFDGEAVWALALDGTAVRLSLNGEVLGRVPLDGVGGSGLAYGGGELFRVAPRDSVGAIAVAVDVETGASRTLAVPPVQFRPLLAYGGRRGSLFIAEVEGGGTAVVEVDAQTGAVRGRFRVGYPVRSVAYSDGRDVLYLQPDEYVPYSERAVRLVDPNTGDLIRETPVSMTLMALAADGTASPLYLDVDPASGTLASGESVATTLTMDASRLNDGTYEALVDVEVDGAVAASLPVTLEVEGMPRLSVGERPVLFGDVPVETVARDTVYVGNTGTAALTVDLSADPAAGFDVRPASVELAPGDSTGVALSFSPTVAGEVVSALTLATNDPDAPTASVVLRGRGVRPPEVTAAPEAIMATVEAGATTSTALVVGNAGDQTLTYTARAEAVGGGVPALFVTTSNNRIVRYDPDTFEEGGAFPNSRTSYGGGTDGLASDGTFLYFAPSDRAEVTVYDPATGAVVRTLRLPEVSVRGLAHDGTRLYAAGAISTRDVLRYTPDATAVEGRLPLPEGYVFDGDLAYGDDVLYVLATTLNGDDAVVRLDAETGASLGALATPGGGQEGIAYVDGALVISQSGSFVVVDPATGAVSRDPGYLGVDSGPLALVESLTDWASVAPAAGTVAGGASGAVTVTFDAAGLVAGTYTGAVVLASNDPERPELRVPFTLTVTGEPDVTVAPTALAFGDVFVGAVAERTVTVGNGGTAPLTATFSASDAAVTVRPASAVVVPGASVTVTVRYAPLESGPLEGTFTVASDDPNESSVAVALSGAAVAPPVAELVAPDARALTTEAGESATTTLTLRNTGEAPLAWSVVGRPPGAPEPSLFVVEGDAILHVDAATGTRVEAVRLPPGTVPLGLAASADSLYYGARPALSNYDEVVYVFSQETGALGRTISIPYRGLRSLAHDGRALYALGGQGFEASVIVLDPGPDGESFSINVGRREGYVPQAGLAAGRGHLFVGVYNSSAGRTEVVETDPRTGRFVGPVAGVASSPLAYADGRLYVRRDGGAQAVDPDTGADLPGPPLGAASFVAGWGPTVGWVAPSPAGGAVAPGDEQEVTVVVGADQLPAGEHEAVLTILTNDPLARETAVPLSLTVVLETPAEGAPGDYAFGLGAPFPNPAGATGTVAFTLPASSSVRLDVFDAAGRHVRRLLDGDLGAGPHQVSLPTAGLAAGVYSVRLAAGDDVAVRRLVVVR